MKILDQHGNPMRVARSFINYYDAARFSRERSFVQTTVQDPVTEMGGFERDEIARHAWHLYKNSPFIRGLIERLVVYTVGQGIHPVPATSNHDWNTRARRAWAQASRQINATSRLSFGACQRVIARGMFIFGDAFTFLGHGASGRPRIQLIESRCIRNKTEKSFTMFDGVQLDANGRPDSYAYHYKSGEDTKTMLVPSDQMVHHYICERAGQIRGVSILASAINTARDVDDILKMEKQAVKATSSVADIVKLASGEVSLEELQTTGGKIASSKIDDKTAYYKTAFGGETKVLNPGDEYSSNIPGRPSPAWEGFMDFLTQTVCSSTGLPPSFLLNMKVGGVDTRRDQSITERVVQPWQDDLAAQFQRIYEHVISHEIEDGSLIDAPTDWRECDWYFPKSPVVDSGRDSKSDIELVKMGMLSRKEYFAQYSQHWEDEMRQVAVEKKRKHDLASEFGVPVHELELLNPNSPPMDSIPQESATDNLSD